MDSNAPLFVGVLLLMTAGVAALLAGEFFHGVEYLVNVGGAVALLAVAGLTAAIARSPPPDHETSGEH
jgi:hypothetical protein